MAWITGKVQIYENPKPRDITVGEPFARKVGGKYYCIETGKEYKVINITSILREKVKSLTQDKEGDN